MKNNLTRRDWFRSTFAISAGLTLLPSLADAMMIAPVSEAEREFFKLRGQSGNAARLNANENPYGPSEKARQAVAQIASSGNRYAFNVARDFKAALAKKEGVPVEYILLGAGSSELLFRAAMGFGLPGGRMLSAFPTYPSMMQYAEQFNSSWDKVNLNDALEHDFDALAAGIKPDTRLVFICNPNNPTGTFVDPAKVKSFCEEVSKKVPVLADEAYLEFLEPAQQISLVDLVKKDENVIVMRTFSKIYGLAGLRLGYMVAKPDLLKTIGQYSSDISLSQPALAAAQASLGDEEFMKSVRTRNAAAREVLTGYLDKKKIFYGKSHANFVLFPSPKAGKVMLSQLEEKGFLIRIWDYKNQEWCRVSIGTIDEMKGFVKAYDEIVSA
jgi:histidinol-phosphate aminotransferase